MANTENFTPAVNRPDAWLHRLTGKDVFLEQMQRYREEHSAEKLCVVAIDMTRMKLFNEWYGQRSGDGMTLCNCAQLAVKMAGP